MLLLSVVAGPAIAGEYYVGTYSWRAWDSYGEKVTLQTTVIADNNTITIKLTNTEPRRGYRGKYQINGTWRNIPAQPYDGPREYISNPTTGLMPNTGYSLVIQLNTIYGSYGYSHGVFDNNNADLAQYTVYTEPDIPHSFSFPTIGQDSVQIRWNNNNNPSDTNYTLQRRTDGETTYQDIITTTNMNEHIDTGLAQDTKYWYRVRVNAKNGYQFFSNEFAVTTAKDPAVASAKAAQTAAETAMAFAEQAKISSELAAQRAWDEIEGKSAATLAKEARDKVNQALAAFNLMSQPVILETSGFNKATCTTGTTFPVTIKAIGATEFRVRANEEWSEWTPIGQYATATGLTSPGVYNIEIEARNGSGAITMCHMMVFKL